MNRRIEFNELLKTVSGITNVYFQPPESLKIQYPAIIYSRSKIQNRMADNTVYSQTTAYNVIVVDKNPDSEIVEKISKMKYSSFNNHYTSDGLNHDSFTIYY